MLAGFQILISHESFTIESQVFSFSTECYHQILTISVATNWDMFSSHSAAKDSKKD